MLVCGPREAQDNLLRSEDWKIIEKEWRTRWMTECKGEVGTLGTVNTYLPPLAPGLDARQVLKGLRSDVRVRVRVRMHEPSAKVARCVLG